MPSKDHLIMFTVPDDVYQAVMNYKKDNGGYFSADTIILGLAVKALRNEGYLAPDDDKYFVLQKAFALREARRENK